MTPSDLTLTALCALAAASIAATVAYSKIAQPVRVLASRWDWAFAFVSCAWCLSAWLSAGVLALKGPNVETTTDWPLLWLATWGLAGLVAAAVRVVALPAVQPIEELQEEEA